MVFFSKTFPITMNGLTSKCGTPGKENRPYFIFNIFKSAANNFSHIKALERIHHFLWLRYCPLPKMLIFKNGRYMRVVNIRLHEYYFTAGV